MLEQIAKQRWKKEGPGTPAPQGGMALYFYMLYTHFWQFLMLNLLFLLWCLPVVTIPMALTALNRVSIKLIRDRNVLFMEEFRHECRSSFWKSLPMGVLFGGLLFGSYYLFSLSLTNGGSFFGMLFGGLGLLALLLAAAWGTYAFALLAVQDLPVGKLLRNAYCLMLLGGKWSLLLLALVLGFAAVLLMVFPVSLILLAVGGIAFLQFSVCWVVNKPLEEYIITRDVKNKSRIEECAK